MKIVSLFLESFRVANRMENARSLADMDRAEQEIGACCDDSRQRASAAASADGTKVFAGPLARHA